MNNYRIQKFTADGKFITKWGTLGHTDGQFIHPLGIDVDSHNRVYVVDQGTSSVQVFSSDGVFIPPRLTSQLSSKDNSTILEDIELDRLNNIYLTDRGNNIIKKYAILK